MRFSDVVDCLEKSAMFVKRYQEGDREVVVLPYVAIYYWLMWPTILLGIYAVLTPSLPVRIAAGVAWVLLIATAVPYWPTIFELKRRMQATAIEASGSKYSFSRPLTYRWKAEEQGG